MMAPKTAMAPMTTPAIAPPPRPDEDEVVEPLPPAMPVEEVTEVVRGAEFETLPEVAEESERMDDDTESS